MFGWGKKKPANPPKGDTAPTTGEFKPPWTERSSTTAANNAIGSLRETLLETVKGERGVHAETLMVVIGALAGFATAYAVHHAWRQSGKVSSGEDSSGTDLITLGAIDGRTYYSGNLLNAYLVPENPSVQSLWGLVAGGAALAGAPKQDLSKIDDTFRHVIHTIGGPDFGIVRAPEDHPPTVTVREVISVLWPLTFSILNRKDAPGANGRGVDIEHWPVAVGIVAQQFLVMSKDVLDPELACAFIMEAAIAASKMDPDAALRS